MAQLEADVKSTTIRDEKKIIHPLLHDFEFKGIGIFSVGVSLSIILECRV
jgi:hypothetical protein